MSRTFNSFRCIFCWACLLVVVIQSANGQGIGTDVCACQPSVYTFTFDFTLTCNDTSISGPGIASTDCSIVPFSSPSVRTLIPLQVISISVLELTKDLTEISASDEVVNIQDGDTYNYTSISNSLGNITNSSLVPAALQLSAIGLNEYGESILMTWVTTFTNQCDVYPVLIEGEQIGWTVLVSIILYSRMSLLCEYLTIGSMTTVKLGTTETILLPYCRTTDSVTRADQTTDTDDSDFDSTANNNNSDFDSTTNAI